MHLRRLGLGLALLASACSSKPHPVPTATGGDGEKPVASTLQVRNGSVHVSLPLIDARSTRPIRSANAFVTIANNGALGVGAPSPGSNSYEATPLGPNVTVEKQLLALTRAAAPPQQPTSAQQLDGSGSAQIRDGGKAGVVCHPSVGVPPPVPAEMSRAQMLATLEQLGIPKTTYARADLDRNPVAIDVVVLADRNADARTAVHVLAQLKHRSVVIGVDGANTPNTIGLRFGGLDVPVPEFDRQTTSAKIKLVHQHVAVLRADGPLEATWLPSTPIDPVALAHAIRPVLSEPLDAMVEVVIDDQVTVQELATPLGVLVAVEAPSVLLTTAAPESDTVPSSVSIGHSCPNRRLDPVVIRRYIQRDTGKLLFCYDKGRALDPTIKGDINLEFVIAPSGAVTGATAHGTSAYVATCVEKLVSGINFPELKGKGDFRTEVPIQFKALD